MHALRPLIAALALAACADDAPPAPPAPPQTTTTPASEAPPEPYGDASGLDACDGPMHLEHCIARLSDREGGPCDPAAPPVAIVRAWPRYTGDAARAGTTGWVELEASVSSAGAPHNPRVVASEPPGVFDAEAIRAFRRWRYCPKAHHGKPLRVRLEFPPAG